MDALVKAESGQFGFEGRAEAVRRFAALSIAFFKYRMKFFRQLTFLLF